MLSLRVGLRSRRYPLQRSSPDLWSGDRDFRSWHGRALRRGLTTINSFVEGFGQGAHRRRRGARRFFRRLTGLWRYWDQIERGLEHCEDHHVRRRNEAPTADLPAALIVVELSRA